jgi:hypothetical protein
MTHPITPPPELVQQWEDKYSMHMPEWVLRHVARESAQWGADQELEACCQHIRDHQWGFVEGPDGTKVHRAVDLQQSRRPKPPSLKEEAMQALCRFMAGEGHDDCTEEEIEDDFKTIRRALEALKE